MSPGATEWPFSVFLLAFVQQYSSVTKSFKHQTVIRTAEAHLIFNICFCLKKKCVQNNEKI